MPSFIQTRFHSFFLSLVFVIITAIFAALLLIQPTVKAEAAVLFRVNSGGVLLSSLDGGPDWEADSGANPSAYHNNGSQVSSFVGGTIHPSVPLPTPPQIFDTERWDPPGNPEMTWSFPVGAAGIYEVRFYLKNGWEGADTPGTRVYNIEVEGQTFAELTDIDLAAEFGHQAGAMKSITVSSDANLDITFFHSIENPLINGIEILIANTEELLSGAPGSQDFGNVEINSTTWQEITLTNNGLTNTITITEVTINGSSAFTNTLPLSSTIEPGASASLEVSFSPTEGSVENGVLLVDHSGINSPLSISLEGTGYDPANPPGVAFVGVTLNSGINASTFSSGAFEISNTSTISTAEILSVTIDLSTSLLPDMVFDPHGTAGDTVAKCLTADGGAGAVGFTAPADLCTDPFSGANSNGYDTLTLSFTDFQSGETFNFSVDVDPTSIQGTGAPGPGESGSVSGLELTGSAVVVEFSGGSSQSARLYKQPGSSGGSQNTVKQNPAGAPTISMVGLPNPATVNAPNQVVHITGPADAEVLVLIVEGAFYVPAGGAYDPDPYEANSAVKVTELNVTLDNNGEVDIGVTLTDSVDSEGGFNYILAVIVEPDGSTSDTSNVVVVEYDPDGQPTISFQSGELIGTNLTNPTSLDFGPDERLYVAEQGGLIKVLTIARNGSADYEVVDSEVIDLIQTKTPNHDDDGTENSTKIRQITGILASGTADNPVLYVNSSDWRISVGVDSGLDTNSGVLSRLSWIGAGIDDPFGRWEKVDIVRGLPRSEENHSNNGLTLDESSNILYFGQGGHTNKGAPSNNFNGTPEYFLSGAILSVDLTAIEALPVYTDTRSGELAIYDLPTLNDPGRVEIDNSHPEFPYPPGHPKFSDIIDIGDPFGGNNGSNMAISEPGGPVQIYALGFRNPYDVVLTQNGRMYAFDNGPNNGWGGLPLIYDVDDVLLGDESSGVIYDPANGQYCTNEYNENGSSFHGDNLHLVTGLGYYGGFPSPTRAFPSKASIPIYEKISGSWQATAVYTLTELLPTGLTPADFPGNPIECGYSAEDGTIDFINSSTNGITEYTAGNFNGAMQGDILAVSFNGNVYRYNLNDNGDAYDIKETLFSGFATTPLDITVQSSVEIYPGTVWVANYSSNNVTAFDPIDFAFCSGLDDLILDEDDDGFSNADEIDNFTNPCSAASMPPDFDGDRLSDLNDPDDDNDGILDINDPFAIDVDNGRTTELPVEYPFWNSDPGTGFFGLGFTGLMINNSDDYLELFDPEAMAAGGAAGLMTIEIVTEGEAYHSNNSQENAFQFGINIDSSTDPFVVHTQVESPFFDGDDSPENNQSAGLFIGSGDQDNYLKAVLGANADEFDGGIGGIQVLLEVNGLTVSNSIYGPNSAGDILSASEIDLYMIVDPGSREAQVQFSKDGGTTVVNLGSPILLPESWFNPNNNWGMAVGIISTAFGSNESFSATWDFISVTYLPPEARAFVGFNLNGDIDASTSSTGAIEISNSSPISTVNILTVTIDLSTSLLPDMVFDPHGTAGDTAAKCLTADGGESATGFKAPADPCTDPFGGAHSSGYDTLTLSFNDFQPGETFNFSVDIDPTSIKGTEPPGPGGSGFVAGVELSGVTIRIDFSGGSSYTSRLYKQPESDGGAQNMVKQNQVIPPTISVVGLPNPATVDTPEQTVRVTGPAGAKVKLLIVEGAFYEPKGGADEPDPYIANSAVMVSERNVTLDGNGEADIEVTLTNSAYPEGGINSMMAVIAEADGSTGDISNIVVVDYDPGQSPNNPPTIDPISNIMVQEGKTLKTTFSIVDTDGDSITTTITSLPDAALFASTIVGNSLPGVYEITLIFRPLMGDAGIYVFAVAADDGVDRSEEDFTLTVFAPDETILYFPVLSAP